MTKNLTVSVRKPKRPTDRPKLRSVLFLVVLYFSGLKSGILLTLSPKCLRLKGITNQFPFEYIGFFFGGGGVCLFLVSALLRIAPSVGTAGMVQTPTLVAALLISSRVGADLGRTSDRFYYQFLTSSVFLEFYRL